MSCLWGEHADISEYHKGKQSNILWCAHVYTILNSSALCGALLGGDNQSIGVVHNCWLQCVIYLCLNVKVNVGIDSSRAEKHDKIKV